MHGGSILAESEGEGCGARFTVTLPIASVQDAQRRSSSDRIEIPPTDLKDLRVLIVDDDAATREVVARTLREYSAITQAAASADEAIRLFSQMQHDILICDIGMPVKDGYALIRELREKNITVPAIALTAYTRSEDRGRALAAGYNVHVPKPINPQELVTVVSELARQNRPGIYTSGEICSASQSLNQDPAAPIIAPVP
jgi:CheY-like chemotaxis protein